MFGGGAFWEPKAVGIPNVLPPDAPATTCAWNAEGTFWI